MTTTEKHLVAVTSLTLALTELVVSLSEEHLWLVEELQAVSGKTDGVLRLLSQIDQRQAGLRALREYAKTVERELRSSGLV